ncbi:hypothetical protein SLA2020_174620 [Shorea laevis]
MLGMHSPFVYRLALRLYCRRVTACRSVAREEAILTLMKQISVADNAEPTAQLREEVHYPILFLEKNLCYLSTLWLYLDCYLFAN